MGVIGSKASAETRAKMSLAHKGKVKSAEHLAKISAALTGKKQPDSVKERLREVNTGKRLSEETKKKIGESCKGRHWKVSAAGRENISAAQKLRFETQDVWNKGKSYDAIKGDKHPFWKGGITDADRAERARFRNTMQRRVFERDGYQCVLCSKTGALSVDHIKRWSEYPELRFDMNNCRTLCMACHYEITYGKKLPQGSTWGHNLIKKRDEVAQGVAP